MNMPATCHMSMPTLQKAIRGRCTTTTVGRTDKGPDRTRNPGFFRRPRRLVYHLTFKWEMFLHRLQGTHVPRPEFNPGPVPPASQGVPRNQLSHVVDGNQIGKTSNMTPTTSVTNVTHVTMHTSISRYRRRHKQPCVVIPMWISYVQGKIISPEFYGNFMKIIYCQPTVAYHAPVLGGGWCSAMTRP